MSNIKTVSSNHNKAELNGELKSSDEQKRISAIAATRNLAPPPPPPPLDRSRSYHHTKENKLVFATFNEWYRNYMLFQKQMVQKCN